MNVFGLFYVFYSLWSISGNVHQIDIFFNINAGFYTKKSLVINLLSVYVYYVKYITTCVHTYTMVSRWCKILIHTICMLFHYTRRLTFAWCNIYYLLCVVHLYGWLYTVPNQLNNLLFGRLQSPFRHHFLQINDCKSFYIIDNKNHNNFEGITMLEGYF